MATEEDLEELWELCRKQRILREMTKPLEQYVPKDDARLKTIVGGS